jgi:hypothetical protein
MSEQTIRWEDTLNDASQMTAKCRDCDWHREGTGREAAQEIMDAAREHMNLGHYIEAELN